MSLRLTLVAAAALAAAPAAGGAITLASGVASPSLRVDESGNAEISWTAQGRRRVAVVRPTGLRASESRLVGSDVSEPVRGVHIPFQKVIRSAPGGWYYALQSRRVGDRVELRFARWHGVPTEISLKATIVPRGIRLTGQATLDGKPLPPSTASRMRAQIDVKIDGVWRRLTTVALNSTGAYNKLVPDSGDRTYRVVVAGPSLAPDASAIATAIEIDPGR